MHGLALRRPLTARKPHLCHAACSHAISIPLLPRITLLVHLYWLAAIHIGYIPRSGVSAPIRRVLEFRLLFMAYHGTYREIDCQSLHLS